jgi:hypothetical protein
MCPWTCSSLVLSFISNSIIDDRSFSNHAAHNTWADLMHLAFPMCLVTMNDPRITQITAGSEVSRHQVIV